TNSYTGSFSATGSGEDSFLGHSVWSGGAPGQDEDLRGSMDEVRVWKRARTQEEIRENMGRRLTGNESDLVGLWNFDDPSNLGRDASPNGNHGAIVGRAVTVAWRSPLLLYGNITDSAGNTIPGATVEIRRANGDVQLVSANQVGEYGVPISPDQ